MRILESHSGSISGIELLQQDADLPGVPALIGDMSLDTNRHKRIVGERVAAWYNYADEASIELSLQESRLVVGSVAHWLFDDRTATKTCGGLVQLMTLITAEQPVKHYLFDGIDTSSVSCKVGRTVNGRLQFLLRNPDFISN